MKLLKGNVRMETVWCAPEILSQTESHCRSDQGKQVNETVKI